MPVHMNLFVAPIPYAGELAGAQQALPQAYAETTRQQAFERLVQERTQVPKTEAGDGLQALSKDRGQQEQPLYQQGRRRRQPLEEDPVITHAHTEGPWQGMIINVNV